MHYCADSALSRQDGGIASSNAPLSSRPLETCLGTESAARFCRPLEAYALLSSLLREGAPRPKRTHNRGASCTPKKKKEEKRGAGRRNVRDPRTARHHTKPAPERARPERGSQRWTLLADGLDADAARRCPIRQTPLPAAPDTPVTLPERGQRDRQATPPPPPPPPPRTDGATAYQVEQLSQNGHAARTEPGRVCRRVYPLCLTVCFLSLFPPRDLPVARPRHVARLPVRRPPSCTRRREHASWLCRTAVACAGVCVGERERESRRACCRDLCVSCACCAGFFLFFFRFFF